MIYAVFQSPGRQPFVIDIFMMFAIGLHTKSTNSFSNLGWIPSGPGDLFLSRFFYFFPNISFSYCDLINNFVASWLKVWEVSFQFVGEYTAELMLDELFHHPRFSRFGFLDEAMLGCCWLWIVYFEHVTKRLSDCLSIVHILPFRILF